MKTITDAGNVLVLHINTPSQAESLMHSQGQAARDLGFYINSDKSEFIYVNRDGAISSLNNKLLNLVHITW